MIYSKTCEYAIRALMQLMLKGDDAFASTSEISEASAVPKAYVAKIFQSLVRAGILKSRRGVDGGVAFMESPSRLTLIDIVAAIDDLSPLHECAMGLERCEDGNSCPLHEIWKNAKEEILATLKDTRLTDLKQKANTYSYRELQRARLNPMTTRS